VVDIGVIGGDGIAPEVVRAGMKVLEAAANDDPSLELGFTEFPWGCEYYLELRQDEVRRILLLGTRVNRPS
jgi:isocitrate/isopropylmalate dehydrogenase